MEAQHEVLVPEVRPMVSASPTFPHSSPKSSGSRSESKLLGFVPSFLWGGHQNTDVEISSPSGFRHTSSISYNTAEGGFTLRNIPTEWKKLFKNVKIKKSEMRDPVISKYIIDTVADALAPRSPPPPPSQGQEKKPPPPSMYLSDLPDLSALSAEQEDRVAQSLATAVSKLRNEKKIKEEEEEEWIDSDDDWSE